MGQIVQVEFPVLQSLVTNTGTDMAWMRIYGEQKLWGQEMGASESGLPVYRSLLQFLASSVLSITPNRADYIASLGILTRKNNYSLIYQSIRYPILEVDQSNYKYDSDASFLTFKTIVAMLRGTNIKLING